MGCGLYISVLIAGLHSPLNTNHLSFPRSFQFSKKYKAAKSKTVIRQNLSERPVCSTALIINFGFAAPRTPSPKARSPAKQPIASENAQRVRWPFAQASAYRQFHHLEDPAV